MTALDGDTLLRIARGAVLERFGGAANSLPADAWLQAPGAAFVTIRKGTELHGCIGTVEALRPLGATVARNALLAAFEDPRSAPLVQADIDHVRIEVSILSAPEKFDFTTEEDARSKLSPFVDGVILSCVRRRGVFLPQVWHAMPEPRAFLDALKQKAGLSRDAWYDGIILERFSVERFAEVGYAGH